MRVSHLHERQPEQLPTEIIVRSCKYDGTEHRRWKTNLIQREGSMLVLDGAFDAEINHPILGTIARGTKSVEHFWTDRWYSIFRFSEPTGGLRNYYCNVNAPPEFNGRVLTFVDLDIDLLVAPDLTYKILDEEEFRENSLRFKYPFDVRQRVQSAVEDLIEIIETRQFPFDHCP